MRPLCCCLPSNGAALGALCDAHVWGQSKAVGKSGSKAPLKTLLNQGVMCRCRRMSARLPKEEVTFSVLVSLLFLDQLGLSSLATKW